MQLLSIQAGLVTVKDVRVSEVGGGTYRLDEEPALFFGAESEDEADSFPRFGDIFKAEKVNAHTLRYLGVHERGPYRHHEFTLPAALGASEALNAFLGSVVAEGGHWERHLEGVLFLAVSAHSHAEPRTALAEISRGA